MAGSGLVNQFIPPGPERSNIGCLAYISHGVKPVGYPVAEVPGEEHRRRDPHRPGVDVVHQVLLPLAETNLWDSSGLQLNTNTDWKLFQTQSGSNTVCPLP